MRFQTCDSEVTAAKDTFGVRASRHPEPPDFSKRMAKASTGGFDGLSGLSILGVRWQGDGELAMAFLSLPVVSDQTAENNTAMKIKASACANACFYFSGCLLFAKTNDSGSERAGMSHANSVSHADRTACLSWVIC